MVRWMTLGMGLVGCATPEPEETPLEGPGFDDATGALIAKGETFVVAVTHLQVRNAPGPGRRFGDHADAVGNDLFDREPEGWVGAAFRNVGRLNWWTVTVWEDEAALLEWVVSEPHASAMLDFVDITVGGESRSFELAADDLPITWPDALDRLLDDPDFQSGDSDWYVGQGEL